MSSAVVRVDANGRDYLDWNLDQGSRWAHVGTYREGENDPTAPVIDVTGYSGRMLVCEADGDRPVVMDLETPVELVVDGPVGTFAWDISAVDMADLWRVTYDYEFRISPEGNPALTYVLAEGRLVMRPMIPVPA